MDIVYIGISFKLPKAYRFLIKTDIGIGSYKFLTIFIFSTQFIYIIENFDKYSQHDAFAYTLHSNHTLKFQ